MRVLIWQWGRRGAGPRFAVTLADRLQLVPGTETLLSLSTGAEILHSSNPPACALPVATYASPGGLAWRLSQAPFIVPGLVRKLRHLRPDVAICAMPGPLDLLCAAALRRARVPFVVVVHDADAHPGDSLPLLMRLQRVLTRRADAVVALTEHVATRLCQQGLVSPRRVFLMPHPPFQFGPAPLPCAHGGPLRLLCFGRLLSYKGLDLLAAAASRLNPALKWQLRVVGQGPDSAELAELRALPNVTVENRWVPEDEIGALIAWADALVLPYREASQSGVAAAAIAAGRFVISTRVGGLVEQLQDEPLARLCEPNADALLRALGDLLQCSDVAVEQPRPDPQTAWVDVAARLLQQITTQVLGQPRPPQPGRTAEPAIAPIGKMG